MKKNKINFENYEDGDFYGCSHIRICPYMNADARASVKDEDFISSGLKCLNECILYRNIKIS